MKRPCENVDRLKKDAFNLTEPLFSSDLQEKIKANGTMKSLFLLYFWM